MQSYSYLYVPNTIPKSQWDNPKINSNIDSSHPTRIFCERWYGLSDKEKEDMVNPFEIQNILSIGIQLSFCQASGGDRDKENAESASTSGEDGDKEVTHPIWAFTEDGDAKAE